MKTTAINIKGILLTSAILIFATVTSFAQTSATANLNLKINSIQSIAVGGANVALEFKTVDDFTSGVETEMQDHLTVFSTGGFTVFVKTTSDLKGGPTGSDIIEASRIKVTASKGTGSTLASPSFTPVNLKTTPQFLIRSTEGGSGEKFNVSYKALGNINTGN